MVTHARAPSPRSVHIWLVLQTSCVSGTVHGFRHVPLKHSSWHSQSTVPFGQEPSSPTLPQSLLLLFPCEEPEDALVEVPEVGAEELAMPEVAWKLEEWPDVSALLEDFDPLVTMDDVAMPDEAFPDEPICDVAVPLVTVPDVTVPLETNPDEAMPLVTVPEDGLLEEAPPDVTV